MIGNLATGRCKFKKNCSISFNKIKINAILLCYMIFLYAAQREVSGSPLTTDTDLNNDYRIHHTSHNKKKFKSDTCHLIPNKDQVCLFLLILSD